MTAKIVGHSVSFLDNRWKQWGTLPACQLSLEDILALPCSGSPLCRKHTAETFPVRTPRKSCSKEHRANKPARVCGRTPRGATR